MAESELSLYAQENELAQLEQEFAYLFATSVIESNCVHVADDGDMRFFDTRSGTEDVTDHVRYLQSRRLLDLHPQHPHWVSLRDEGEPLPEGQGGY